MYGHTYIIYVCKSLALYAFSNEFREILSCFMQNKTLINLYKEQKGISDEPKIISICIR